MIDLQNYITDLSVWTNEFINSKPWSLTTSAAELILEKLKTLHEEYHIRDSIAIHKSAVVEEHVILKAPLIISAGCFVGAHAYLRGGVYVGEGSSIGPGCEIKSSFIFHNSALAHFNFVGDSLVGSHVNLEAGAVIANHYNERTDKTIRVTLEGKQYATLAKKFGALVGDHSRVGANAVLSPGTLLLPHSVVNRLELIEQNP